MDFDYVFTDNRALVFEDGRKAVFVSRPDGMDISLLRKIDNKLPVLRNWSTRNNLSMDQVAFVGNNVNDIECMEAVGTSISIADAHPAALKAANLVLSANGGRGTIREVADMIVNTN
jgi:YrbI family 3-deoxy-D-manno-octulosonate 8-phosphate phosphatase